MTTFRDRWLTLQEAAAELRISMAHARMLTDSGVLDRCQIDPLKVGVARQGTRHSRIFVRRADVERYDRERKTSFQRVRA